jgi:hypothetical protein
MQREKTKLDLTEFEKSTGHLLHPQWIKEKLTHPFDRMTMVVCRDLVPLSIERLVDNIGLAFDYENSNTGMYGISYFTKAGCPQITEFCQPGIDLVVSAGNIVEMIKKFPERRFRLYIGKPNEVDLQSGYLQVLTSEELTKISKQFTPEQCRQIDEVLFDGNPPEKYNGSFQDYFREMKSHPLVQNRKVSFRINTQIERNDLRHGQIPKLTFVLANEIKELLPPHCQGGYNVYSGNPITSQVADSLAELLNLPDLDKPLEPWYVPRIRIGPGNEDYIGFPEQIYIGGFGGFGDKIPYEAIRNLILRVKNANKSTKVILELGTKLVEDTCVLVTPEKPENVELSDVTNGMSDMLYFELPNIGTVIVRPVSYEFWQNKLPNKLSINVV